jgi:hypothetical protein
MMCVRVPLVTEEGSQSVWAVPARIPLKNGPRFICLSSTFSAPAWATERVSSEATNETYAL